MNNIPVTRDIDLAPGRLKYVEHYIPDPLALYNDLEHGVEWDQPVLTLFGRQHRSRRLVSFVGDAGLRYRYSGHTHNSAPWPSSLVDLRERLLADFDFAFNAALLNFYRDGSEAMGYHSDDEPELGDAPIVASVSVGAARDFVMRRKGESRQSHLLSLGSGSLLLMLPPCQAHWQHALPARKRVDSGRINITFRHILPCA